ncbi:Metridin-like ShK toxin, partial [Aphelenchoides avenae]
YGIDCQQQKSKCKIPQWTAVLFQACPLTCGLCNVGVCKDNIQGCSSLKTLCRDSTYRSYMEQNCARTCNTCQKSGGVGAYSCDSFVAWCQGTVEQQNTMRTSCKKMCGFCG